MSGRLPDWAVWQGGNEYTLGAEEEVMLLSPHDWSLAQQIDRVLPQEGIELARELIRSHSGLGSGDRSPARIAIGSVFSRGG